MPGPPGSARVFALAWGLVLLAIGAGATAGVKSTVSTYRSGPAEVSVECFAPTTGGRHPAALLLHGSGGLDGATGDVFRGMARSMAQKGYVVLIPHYFDREEQDDGWAEAVRDAIEVAASRDDVDPDRLGLFGFSLGAHLAFNRASRDDRVKAVVALSGRPPVGPDARVPPTLVLRGSKDPGVTPQVVRDFEEAMKTRQIPCLVHVYPGQGHNFEAGKFADVGQRMMSFFDQHVKPRKPRAGADGK